MRFPVHQVLSQLLSNHQTQTLQLGADTIEAIELKVYALQILDLGCYPCLLYIDIEAWAKKMA